MSDFETLAINWNDTPKSSDMYGVKATSKNAIQSYYNKL